MYANADIGYVETGAGLWQDNRHRGTLSIGRGDAHRWRPSLEREGL